MHSGEKGFPKKRLSEAHMFSSGRLRILLYLFSPSVGSRGVVRGRNPAWKRGTPCGAPMGVAGPEALEARVQRDRVLIRRCVHGWASPEHRNRANERSEAATGTRLASEPTPATPVRQNIIESSSASSCGGADRGWGQASTKVRERADRAERQGTPGGSLQRPSACHDILVLSLLRSE